MMIRIERNKNNLGLSMCGKFWWSHFDAWNCNHIRKRAWLSTLLPNVHEREKGTAGGNHTKYLEREYSRDYFARSINWSLVEDMGWRSYAMDCEELELVQTETCHSVCGGRLGVASAVRDTENWTPPWTGDMVLFWLLLLLLNWINSKG